ncbi:unnamed protein product [Vitrella brassicaformis CCMP3155]|uniref:Uncharacterized protein n=4 Tax=Vitrella brassicaformis TaxID=1169539 RepID=A0A0G4EZ12_VITBC|nr:unnamed protein product [Vitrella brassicaformis CCMP3155]|eukprot:CEM04541.1 unnamed protein product [Vitrella brassicaformis CCMP3155]
MSESGNRSRASSKSRATVLGQEEGGIIASSVEGLFAVIYVLDSTRRGLVEESGGGFLPYVKTTIVFVLEFVQLVPLLLPEEDIAHCPDFDLFDSHCFADLWMHPLGLLAGSSRTQYLTVTIAVALLVVIACVGVVFVARSFQTQEVHLTSAIFGLRMFVNIGILTLFTTTTRLLSSMFTCSSLQYYVEGHIKCWSPAHNGVLFVSVLALTMFLPFSALIFYLYNHFFFFTGDPAAAAHGRVELLFFLTKCIVITTFIYTISTSGAAVYCSSLNALALFVISLLSFLQCPFYEDFTNRLRLGLFLALFVLPLNTFIKNGSVTAGMSAAGFLIGMGSALVRKSWLSGKVMHEVHLSHTDFGEDYKYILTTLMNEIAENPQRNRTSFLRGGPSVRDVPGAAVAIEDGEEGYVGSEEGLGAGLPPATYDNEIDIEHEVMLDRIVSKHRMALIKKALFFETDVDLMLRYFVDEWPYLSHHERQVSVTVIQSVTFAALHGKSKLFKAFGFAWYTLFANKCFEETVMCYKYLKLAKQFSSIFQLDILYLCYQLDKDIETARQSSYFGAQEGGQLNLMDLMTYRKFSQSAKDNHRRALERLMEFWKQLTLASYLECLQPGHDPTGKKLTGVAKGKVTHLKKLLNNAVGAARRADSAYKHLTVNFSKSSESGDNYASFLRSVYQDPVRASYLMVDKEDGASSQKGSSKGGSSHGSWGNREAGAEKEERCGSLETRKLRIVNLLKLVLGAAYVILAVVSLISHFVGAQQMSFITEKMEDLDHQGVLSRKWSSTCEEMNLISIYQQTDHVAHPEALDLIHEQDMLLFANANDIIDSFNLLADNSLKEGMKDLVSVINLPSINLTTFRFDGVRGWDYVNLQHLVVTFASASRQVAEDAEGGAASLTTPHYKLVSEACIGEIPETVLHIVEMQLSHVSDSVASAITIFSLWHSIVALFTVVACLGTAKVVRHHLREYDSSTEIDVVIRLAVETPINDRKKLRRIYRRHLVSQKNEGDVARTEEFETFDPRNNQQAIEEAEDTVVVELSNIFAEEENRPAASDDATPAAEPQAPESPQEESPADRLPLPISPIIRRRDKERGSPSPRRDRGSSPLIHMNTRTSEAPMSPPGERLDRRKVSFHRAQGKGPVTAVHEYPAAPLSGVQSDAARKAGITASGKDVHPSRQQKAIRGSASPTSSPTSEVSPGDRRRGTLNQGMLLRRSSVVVMSCRERLHRAWTAVYKACSGKYSRVMLLFWTVLLAYLIAKQVATTTIMKNLAEKKEDLAILKEVQFHLAQMAVLAPDVVEQRRMDWRPLDQTAELLADFGHELEIFREKFSLLMWSGGAKAAARSYEPRTKLLFEPQCLLKQESCDNRTHPFPGSDRLEHGLYEAIVVWAQEGEMMFDQYHLRYLLQHPPADPVGGQSRLRQSLIQEILDKYEGIDLDTIRQLPRKITFDEPEQFWFTVGAVEYDLHDGLDELKKTFLDEANDELQGSLRLSWLLTGVALCVIVIAVICFMYLLDGLRNNVLMSTTMLRTLPWPIVHHNELIHKVFHTENSEEDNESLEDAEDATNDDTQHYTHTSTTQARRRTSVSSTQSHSKGKGDQREGAGKDKGKKRP